MLYLQTRSSAEDYTFFGDNPPHRWWSTRYQQFFEDGEFNVFVEITPPKWRAFVGGITGSRTDRIGRSIRYEFAGEGDRADADAAFFNHLLVFLLSGCQNSEAINKRLSSLTSLLDNKWFTQKFVDSLDKERQTDNTKKAIQERLMEIGRLLEEKVPISKFVANLTWSAGAYSLQWETISQFLSALQMLVAPAPSKSSGCLVITSLPLEKEQIMAFMRVFQVKYPDAKTLWLSSWEGYQAPDPTTTPIFRLPEPIQLPSPKPPPPPLPVSAPPSATPSSGDTQEKKNDTSGTSLQKPDGSSSGGKKASLMLPIATGMAGLIIGSLLGILIAQKWITPKEVESATASMVPKTEFDSKTNELNSTIMQLKKERDDAKEDLKRLSPKDNAPQVP